MSAPPRRAGREPAPRRRLSGLGLLGIVIAVCLAAFAVGFLFTAVFLFGGGAGAEFVSVPDLRGQTEAEGRRTASRLGLEVELGPTLINPDVAEGRVLAQSPLPGEEVAPGSAIRLTISAGPERRPVPEVRSLSGRQARELLERSGFDVVAEERTDPTPAGRVLEVTPGPGTPLEMPATVRLVVSAGPPRAAVPDVVGTPEPAARERLDEAGFFVGAIDYDPFSMEPPGVVIGQDPRAGVEVPVGTGVNLIVAGSRSGNL